MSFQDLSDSRRPTANDRILGDPEGRGGSIGAPAPDDPAPRDPAPGTPGTPVQTLQVYPAAQFCVTHGVNLDDPLSIAGELELEDIYALGKNARIGRLALAAGSRENGFTIAAGSELGRAGAEIFLDCLITLMAPDGTTIEALVLVETDAGGLIAQIWFLPLSPLVPNEGYSLITIDREAARARLAQSACVSFTRGTRITMADGRQVPVEELVPGDRILTKDSGPKELRWIGQQTLRASGAFAPITIAAGALNNINELTVSPNHRLFVYQRVDHLGAGQKEVMVKARNLVNGTSVVQSEGGFVDYFQLLFDKHEIIFAEGIASESLFLDTTTGPVVPHEVQARIKDGARPDPAGLEVRKTGENGENMVELLRRASSG